MIRSSYDRSGGEGGERGSGAGRDGEGIADGRASVHLSVEVGHAVVAVIVGEHHVPGAELGEPDVVSDTGGSQPGGGVLLLG
jgi:hypothetical protein